MIDSIQIHNFRCFKELDLDGLKRVNVIVGRNASGKTSLLESIFLAAGASPEIVLRLRSWRGLGDRISISRDTTSYRSLWEDLFFSLEQERIISISLTGSPRNTRSVRIFYSQQATLTIPIGDDEIEAAGTEPITFEWRDNKGQLYTARPKLTPEGLNLGGSFPTMDSAFFASSLKPNPSETAARFSELSKRKMDSDLVGVLRSEFPLIENVSVEVSAGITMLYASIDKLHEKLPLAVVSEGINKLVSILAAIAKYSKGVIIVDEIDNGFHYEKLPSLWKILLEFSKKFNTQIFVSTHNRECLNALLPTLERNEDEFCMVRTEKLNGYCGARMFSGRDLRSAIAQEVEVR